MAAESIWFTKTSNYARLAKRSGFPRILLAGAYGIAIGMIVSNACLSNACLAGMPSVLPAHWQGAIPQLTEVTTERLQAISFFAAGLLVCTLAIQSLWNIIAKNSVWLPKLSFSKAFVLILLWGALFVIVLTMISGARELLTPGAWKQEGMIYKLKTEAISDAAK